MALWRRSGFSLRTLKKGNELFYPSLFLVAYASVDETISATTIWLPNIGESACGPP